MTHTERATQGLTLVEVLVVSLIFAVIIGVVFLIAESGRNTWLMTDAQLESQTDAQRALDRMAADLRGAQISQVRCLDGGAGPLEIGLDETANEIEYTYDAVADTLTRTVGNINPIVVGSKLTAFSCAGPTNQVVTLTVTSQGGQATARQVPQTLSTTVWIQLP
jgi:type II secretory pathway component PulJ